VHTREAELAIASGADAAAAFARSGRLCGALIGIAGAVGGLGGVGINLAFRTAYGASGSGTVAFAAFLGYYAICLAVTWAVYLRRREEHPVSGVEPVRPKTAGRV
jgi:NNP family nitrate/nitrite transporter-like MFS transporter